MKYCVVCKRKLQEENETNICENLRCGQALEARKSLYSRIQQYKDFFTGKLPTEDNYIEYFKLCGQEEKYQDFIAEEVTFITPSIKSVRPALKVSRRTYFYTNVISIHPDWPTEKQVNALPPITIP